MKQYQLLGCAGTLILLLGSCSKRLTTSQGGGAPHAVHTIMQRQVQNAVDAGDGDAIARSLRERMTAAPDDIEIRISLAEHYRKQGITELAIEHFRLAAERLPDSSRLALLLAQTLDEQGQTREAATALAHFLERTNDPDPELPAWLGIFRDKLGDWQEGESAHRAALARNPSNAAFHNNLGYNLLKQGKRAEAALELRKALEIQPRLEVARNNLALALMHEAGPEQKREAVEHWQSVSTPSAAHNNAAAALIEQGRLEEARKELETALVHQRDFVPALKNMALLSELDGKPAAVPAAKKSGFRRFMRKAWVAFAGIEEKPDGRVAQTARK